MFGISYGYAGYVDGFWTYVFNDLLNFLIFLFMIMDMWNSMTLYLSFLCLLVIYVGYVTTDILFCCSLMMDGLFKKIRVYTVWRFAFTGSFYPILRRGSIEISTTPSFSFTMTKGEQRVQYTYYHLKSL